MDASDTLTQGRSASERSPPKERQPAAVFFDIPRARPRSRAVPAACGRRRRDRCARWGLSHAVVRPERYCVGAGFARRHQRRCPRRRFSDAGGRCRSRRSHAVARRVVDVSAGGHASPGRGGCATGRRQCDRVGLAGSGCTLHRRPSVRPARDHHPARCAASQALARVLGDDEADHRT